MRQITYKTVNIFLFFALVAIENSTSVIYTYNKYHFKHYGTNRRAECVKKVSEILFQSSIDLHLVVENNLVDDDFYKKLNQFFSLTIGNTTTFESKKNRYIIIIENISYLKKLLQRSSFSRFSQYLILTNSSTEIVSKFASYLYRNEFYYVAFMLIGENGDVELNQLNKLNKAHETDDHRNLIITAQCNDTFLDDKNFQSIVRPFDRVICPRDGCTISYWRMTEHASHRVLYKSLGNGSQVAVSVAAPIIEGFSDKFDIQVKSKLNESSFTSSWKKAVQLMDEKKINLLFGFTLPDSKSAERLEISTYYMFDHLRIVYEIGTRDRNVAFAGLEKLFTPLELQIWIYLASTLVFYGCFTFIVKKIHNQRLIREYLHPKYLINMFTKQDLLLPTNGGLRLIVGMMLMYALLITSAYESAITSTYITVTLVEKLDTLEELMISKHRFAGPGFIRSFFDDPTDRVMKYLHERYETADTNEVIEMMYKDHIVMLHTSLTIQRILWEGRKEVEYYVSKEPFVYFPVIFFMRKGHPYVGALRKFVLQVIAMGIVHRWSHDFVRPQHKQVKVGEATPLNHHQMTSFWLLLLTGMTISSIVFLGELLSNKFLTGRKSKS